MSKNATLGFSIRVRKFSKMFKLFLFDQKGPTELFPSHQKLEVKIMMESKAEVKKNKYGLSHEIANRCGTI
jgi:hypothetical protein